MTCLTEHHPLPSYVARCSGPNTTSGQTTLKGLPTLISYMCQHRIGEVSDHGADGPEQTLTQPMTSERIGTSKIHVKSKMNTRAIWLLFILASKRKQVMERHNTETSLQSIQISGRDKCSLTKKAIPVQVLVFIRWHDRSVSVTGKRAQAQHHFPQLVASSTEFGVCGTEAQGLPHMKG
jgi:hypothetical protein